MQFKVPQFIDIEDKIFGPFSFRQFAYLVGGGGFVYLCLKLLPFPFSAVFALPLAGFALALTFYKYNDKPFINVVEAYLKYITRSKLYIWKKNPPIKAKNMWNDEYNSKNLIAQGDVHSIEINHDMYLHQKESGAQRDIPTNQDKNATPTSQRPLAPKVERPLKRGLTESKLKTLSWSLDVIDNKR